MGKKEVKLEGERDGLTRLKKRIKSKKKCISVRKVDDIKRSEETNKISMEKKLK